LVIAASFTLVRYSYSVEGCWNYINVGFEKYKPDYYLFDTMLYRELEEYGYRKDKLVEMGNAKYDGIFHACQNKVYPNEWEKLKGKKTILWTTDHGIYDGNIADDITFDLYAQTIFKYALDHPEMGFIFRPHLTFIRELLQAGYWELKDLEKLREYCISSPNIVFDESASYAAAYSVADAILTDPLCGIICSALPTLKPICVLYRPDCNGKTYHKELVKNYYSAHDEKGLIDFFEMIKAGKDEMYGMRKEASQKYVKHFDGKNGLRIKEFIEDKYLEMVKCAEF
jgi:hypothetical protein